MGLAGGTDAATAQTDKPGSMPEWAQEMGMTEEEYWSGLHSYSSAAACGPDTTQETARKVEVTQVWFAFPPHSSFYPRPWLQGRFN